MSKKRWGLLGVSLFCFLLVACNQQVASQKQVERSKNNEASSSKAAASLTWLAGDWVCQEWQVTYHFERVKTVWTITNGKAIIGEQVTVKNAQGKTFLLVAANGTQFHVEKISDSQLRFQQEAKKGLLGTTNTVTFVKK